MTGSRQSVCVNGLTTDVTGYLEMHGERISRTLAKFATDEVRRVVEVGSHPWVMTSALIEHPRLELLATVSAEEATLWPDDIGFSANTYEIQTVRGETTQLKNYSFNIERRRVQIDESPDIVFACEIIEHLVRAPHTMLLNINDWLTVGGELFITTPNGSQFMNPFRREARMPAYRAHCYERHSYVYRLQDLIELIELCGFTIVESGFWSPYKSVGLNKLRPLLSRLPSFYFSEKFERSLYVLARKRCSIVSLSRVPSVCAQSGAWEDIADEECLAGEFDRH